MGNKVYIGVDLGGTSVKIGVISKKGELIDHKEIPTRSRGFFQVVINDILHHSNEIIQLNGYSWDDIEGMGIGIPGLLDMERGVVKMAPNLNWQNVPIKWFIEEQLKVPVKIENDGNVAVLGEAWTGAGSQYKHIAMATIGTGIGAGIIIDGHILHGKQGMAAELGHLPISEEGLLCGCGNYGCLETISSATGIIQKGKEVVTLGKDSLLTAQYKDEIDKITAKSIIDAAKEGDNESLQIINHAGKLLGKGLAIIANLFDPQIIIIGGGVSQAGDIILDPIKEGFKEHGLKDIVASVEIVLAHLGNQAGMIGAASLFKK